MFYIFEIIITAIITYIFIKQEKPKLKFLFYGYLFFFLTLILQIPFRYFYPQLNSLFTNNFFPVTIIIIITVLISEITKYLSLKKFIKTKSFKNGILFGIGWSTIESINFFTSTFYTFIFSIFSISFNYTPFLNENLPLVNFVFFFVFNLAITVLVIFSIIKNKIQYLIYAICISLLVPIIFTLLSQELKLIFLIFVFIYSLHIIFKYRKLK